MATCILGGRVETLGQLALALQTQRVASEQTEREMAYGLWDSIRGFKDFGAVQDIRALVGQMYGEELTLESVLRLRGDVCKRRQIKPDDSDAIPLFDVLAALCDGTRESGDDQPGDGSPAQNEGPGEPSATPAIRPDALRILRVLAQLPNQTWTQKAIERELIANRKPLSDNTIRDRLRDLRGAGLCERLNGERGGESITAKGRQVLRTDGCR